MRSRVSASQNRRAAGATLRKVKMQFLSIVRKHAATRQFL